MGSNKESEKHERKSMNALFRVMKTHVVFLFLIAGMVWTSGCASSWVMTDYGRKSETFRGTGPAYGDTTKVYVQGRLNTFYHITPWSDKERPAYMVVELGEKEIKTSNKPIKGNIPSDALEYPEIKFLDRDSFPRDTPLETIFIESGQDVGYFRYNVVFIKNPNDINNPYRANISYWREYYPVSSIVSFPFVLVGALAVDVVTLPFQIIGILVLDSVPMHFFP